VFASTLEYSFGDDMVAAPVIKPVNKTTGLASQKMWVPPGEWILWQTGESHSGPQTINMQAKQTDIPVLVKAGAVLPLKTMASVSDIAPDPLVLQVSRDAGGHLYLHGSVAAAVGAGDPTQSPGALHRDGGRTLPLARADLPPADD
jgi:alpha-glucosidase (family GH31 glycosyl hydrolase)